MQRQRPRRLPRPNRIAEQKVLQKSHIAFLVAPPANKEKRCSADELFESEDEAPFDRAEFAKIDTALRKAKEALDPYESDPNLANTLRAVDVHVGLKFRLRGFDAQIVTNAWLKIYEIVTRMGLFKAACSDSEHALRAFCNAELPGAFVSALNHYVATYHPGVEFDWVASSLIADDSSILGDQYKLCAENPDRWLMDSDCPGDVTQVADIRTLAERAKEKLGEVDLYTSDAGIGVSEDYGSQERLTAHINLGQIVTGLLALRVGGVLVTKMYTFVEEFSISVISVCAALFDSFYVTKPKTSRAANSEVYLVGIGYRGLSPESKERLLGAVDDFDFERPLFPACAETERTTRSLLLAAQQIHERQQVAALNEAVALHRQFGPKVQNLRSALQSVYRNAEKQWLSENPVKKLPPEAQLHWEKNPRGGCADAASATNRSQ